MNKILFLNKLENFARGLWKLMKNWKFLNVSRFFFLLFIFFVPFRIDALFGISDVYGLTFFNDYVAHFFYLSDLFLLFSLFFFALSAVFSEKNDLKFPNSPLTLLLFSFVLSYLVSLSVAVDLGNSLFFLIRAIEFFVVFLMIGSGFVKLKKLAYVFLASMLISAFIGIFQYVFQGSLGFSFLGEPLISPGMENVAKVDIGNFKVLRAYGTFSHPNLFAAYLILALVFCLWRFKDSKILFSLMLFVFSLAFLLTFSRSAFLALFSIVFIYYSIADIKIAPRYIFLTLALLLFFVVSFDLLPLFWERLTFSDSAAISERALFMSISKKMFLAEPFGVGAGNFTLVMQDYTNLKLLPWLYQPVHNIFLLILNELGLAGVLLYLFSVFYILFLLLTNLKQKKKVVLSAMFFSLFIGGMVLGTFDHYFVSLYQGQALMWFVFAFSAKTVS